VITQVDEIDQQEIDAVMQAPQSPQGVLFRRFMQMAIEDPSIFDEIPAEAYVFLLPEDDPELAAQERDAAERFAQKGRPVYVRSMPPAARSITGDVPSES
jgi:hypothetical protein